MQTREKRAINTSRILREKKKKKKKKKKNSETVIVIIINHGPSPFKQRRDRDGATTGKENRPEKERIQKPSETEEAKTELRPAVAHTESENRPEV